MVRVLLAIVGISCLCSSASATTYTATLLHPLGFSTSRGSGISGTSQVGTGFVAPTGNTGHAMIWSGTAASAIDLHPPQFFDRSSASAASGEFQVGAGSYQVSSSTSRTHALLWNGTAASVIDLHPSGYVNSEASDVSGMSQVGDGTVPIPGTANSVRSHALLWHGSYSSVIDLHPPNFDDSSALAVDGSSQAGYGKYTGGLTYHALLWQGTPESVVDLNPAGFTSSRVADISGGSQVGQGDGAATAGLTHALLWHGTAASAIDLNPPGFRMSYGYGISGATQVGSGMPTGSDDVHALVWNGTADSAVDLHPYVAGLSSTFTDSIALGISDTGVIVGNAVDANNKTYAVLWTPNLEPGLAGDYNGNGKVDAADYTIWRNDPARTQVGYDLWRSHFGNTSNSGSAIQSAVPEPPGLLMCLAIASALALRRR